MIKINQIKLNIYKNFDDIYKKISILLKISISNIDKKSLIILKKSIDAREKNNICFVYTIAIKIYNINEELLIKKTNNKSISIYNNDKFIPININIENIKNKKPIIVGFGPSGIFTAYILSLSNIKTIIFERGSKIEDRINDVDNFLKNKILDENSNISFGEGGAGTFSDGKINTNSNVSDIYSKFVLETFVKFGAPNNILYESKPHIGTDIIKTVIVNIRNYLIENGTEIYFNTKFNFENVKNNQIYVLAIGNSSRDTFIEMKNYGFDLKPKNFAIGFRVAHKQIIINNALYGDNDISILKNASYKLTYNNDLNSAYTFCMCPGGFIVNSSNFKNHLSINGLSYSKRDNEYANSAIVFPISVMDYMKNNDSLSGIILQEKIENKAYNLCDGEIPYCFYGNFKNSNDIFNIEKNKIFLGNAKYTKKIIDIYNNLNLKYNIKETFINAMDYFDTKIKKFNSFDTIVAGVETRTSSPIMLLRDTNFESNIKNFYPCGEGFGHGGGILTCCIDGIKVANKIIERYKNG